MEPAHEEEPVAGATGDDVAGSLGTSDAAGAAGAADAAGTADAAKKRKREREAKPAYKKRRRERDARPEAKERRRELDARPEAKERKAEREAQPANKKRRAEQRAEPAAKKKKREREAKPAAKKRKSEKDRETREAAAAASRDDFLARNPDLVGAVWKKERAVSTALKAYEESKFDELGGRTAQEAFTSHKFVIYIGMHGSLDTKKLRLEAFASLSRNPGTRTWNGADGKQRTARTTPAFRYPEGKEKVWGPHAAEAGKQTRPFLTMVEAEEAGFNYLTLAVFPTTLNAKDGEYAVQLKAMQDIIDSDFSGGKKGRPHMPALFCRAPVPVDTKHEMKRAKEQLAETGVVSPATVFILYAEVGDETAQAWAKGGAPDHIILKKTNMRLDLNEC